MNRARAFWQFGEPVHAVIYYSPERQAATDALGLKGGWMSYFGCRAAPLGEVTAPVVTSLFFNFHPSMVARAIPDAWSYASPIALLEARLAAIDATLRRVLGDDTVDAPAVVRASELAAKAVNGCSMDGRALGAANQAVPLPDDPHLKLWQALTTMREHRGDGHVAVLVDAAIDPTEALVLQAATGRSPEDGLRSHRGWSVDEWDSAVERLRARDLVDENMQIAPAGRALRQRIEDDTDRVARPVIASLREEETDELITLLQPLAQRVMESDAVPTHNNMGVPWPPEAGQ